jgi:hypothetical protein
MRGQPVRDIPKKQLGIRVPLDFLRAIEERAKKRYSSVNQEMLMLAKLGLANDKPEDQALDKADKIIESQTLQINSD